MKLGPQQVRAFLQNAIRSVDRVRVRTSRAHRRFFYSWSFMQRRTLLWILSILLLLTMPVLAPIVHAKDKSAKALYKQGQADEAKDDYLGAYEAYAAAYQKDPKNLYYKTSYERLKFTAA